MARGLRLHGCRSVGLSVCPSAFAIIYRHRYDVPFMRLHQPSLAVWVRGMRCGPPRQRANLQVHNLVGGKIQDSCALTASAFMRLLHASAAERQVWMSGALLSAQVTSYSTDVGTSGAISGGT